MQPRPLFSGSESDTDDQPIYDVPPNRQHHVDYIDDDLSDGVKMIINIILYIYTVLLCSNMYMQALYPHL